MSDDRSVPQGWVRATMQDVASIVGGSTPSTSNPAFWNDGDIPWITPADLSGYEQKTISRGTRNITRLGLERSGARLLPAGTVLFSSRAPIGYVGIASNPVATNQGFKSFVLKPGIEPGYIYYYLQFAKSLALSLASGTTFQEISGRKARVIPVVVAPVAEQPRIVEAIESHLSRLDDAVASLERVQAKLKAYRASVLKAAVEGRLVPTEASLARAEKREYEPAEALLVRILKQRRRRWEEAELGKLKAAGKTPKADKWEAKYEEPVAPAASVPPALPEGWCWTSLGQAFTVTVGATPSRSVPDYWDGGIPWVSSGEVSFCRIRDTRETITSAGLDASSTKLNPRGSVLVGMIGEGKTRGQAAILDIDACGNQNAAAIWVSQTEVPPEYVYYYLVGQYETTRRRGSGNNQPALNKARVEAIPLPLPPLDEQRRIVERLEHDESTIADTEATVERERKRIHRLRQAILKWAFEGNLVDQDPTDEPAEKLLARIRAERAAVTPTKKSRGRRVKGAA